jgi:hypothetical protein
MPRPQGKLRNAPFADIYYATSDATALSRFDVMLPVSACLAPTVLLSKSNVVSQRQSVRKLRMRLVKAIETPIGMPASRSAFPSSEDRQSLIVRGCQQRPRRNTRRASMPRDLIHLRLSRSCRFPFPARHAFDYTDGGTDQEG